MAFTLTPLYGQGGSYTAQQDRLSISSQAGTAGVGRITAPSAGAMTGDLAVTTSGTANGNVNIAAGNVWVSAGAGQGFYFAYNDAQITVGGSGTGTTFVSTTATTTRYDVVYVEITDNGTAAPSAAIKILTGTAAVSPATPTVPSLPGGTKGLVLANVLLPVNFTAGATTILAANITDVRKKANMVDASVASTSSVASPAVGNIVYDTSASAVKAYNGSTWDSLLTNSNLLNLNNTNMASGYRLTSQGASAPPSPVDGMLWWDTTNTRLVRYRSSDGQWERVSLTYTGASAPLSSAVDGMMWFDTANQRLMIYRVSDGTWQRLGNVQTTSRTGCILRRTTSANINNAVSATVSWEVEDFDSDGFIAVPSTTITIPAGLGGMYSLAISGQWNYASPVNTGASIRVATAGLVYGYHGSTVVAADSVDAGTYQSSGCSAIVPLAAGDTVQFRVANASGISPLALQGARCSVIRLSL